MVAPVELSPAPQWYLDTLRVEIERLMTLSEWNERRGDLKEAHRFEMSAYATAGELDRLQHEAKSEVSQ